MPKVIHTGYLNVRGDDGEYIKLNTVAEQTAQEQIAEIEAKGEQVRESIPSDYTALSNEVDDLKSAMTNTEADIDALEAGKVAAQQGSGNAGKALVVGADGNVTTGDAGIPEAVKLSLLDLVRHVAYIDDQGQLYYDALYAALYPSAYPRITATFDSGSNTVYVDEGLSALKQYMVVKVYEDADDQGTVIASNDYTLTGTLVDGGNTVVVEYDGMAASVQVEAVDFYNVMHWNSTSNPEIVFAPGLITTAKYHSETNNTVELLPYNTSAPRLSMCANRGICPFLDTSEEETEYYPIPIPANVTSVRVTWTDTAYKISVQQKKYEDQYIFGWIADSGWQTQGSYETEIVTSQTRGRADCIILFVQKGINQPIIGDTPTIDIQFI